MTRRVLKPAPHRPELAALIAKAKALGPMTPTELREQRISFAYGNAAIDNPRITRKMVEEEYDRLYGRPEEQ